MQWDADLDTDKATIHWQQGGASITGVLVPPYGKLVLGGWRVKTKIAGGICTAGDERHRCREESLPCWTAVLVLGSLGGLCLAGSLVGVRSEVGFASAGGAGRCNGRQYSGLLAGVLPPLCGELTLSTQQRTKKERVRSLLQSHPLGLKWRLPTLPLSQYHRHNWA